MKLYVAVVNERHSDTEAAVFSTPEAAITHARDTAAEFARQPEDVQERQINGWLYCVSWSPEGDSAWVVEKTLDRP